MPRKPRRDRRLAWRGVTLVCAHYPVAEGCADTADKPSWSLRSVVVLLAPEVISCAWVQEGFARLRWHKPPVSGGAQLSLDWSGCPPSRSSVGAHVPAKMVTPADLFSSSQRKKGVAPCLGCSSTGRPWKAARCTIA